MRVTVFGGAVIVAGGEWTTVHSDVRALGVATTVWRPLPSLVARRHGPGLAVCGGCVWTAAVASETGSGGAVGNLTPTGGRPW